MPTLSDLKPINTGCAGCAARENCGLHS
jgi:hypothetical protein